MRRTFIFLALAVLATVTSAADGPTLVINEIMYHVYSEGSQGEDLGAEYIELFNQGSEAVNLAGWRFARAVVFTFGDVILEAGEYLIVAADVDTFKARYPGVAHVVGGWDGRLSNSGERIELRDASGDLVDEVPYADSGDWGIRELGPDDRGHRGWRWRNDHDGGGQSLELLNPALSNEYGANWAASAEVGGTPGRANSIAADDVAPLIADAQHAPVIPGALDSVVVTAVVIDESPFGPAVNLRYRIDRSEYAGRDSYPAFDANEYAAVPMFDDGAHEDVAAGDRVYGAEIPPLPDGVVVEFYIEAIDGSGRIRTWPAPSMVDGRLEQVTNALYRVDAAFNPYPDERRAWQIGSQPLYYMVMTEMERGRLADLGSRSVDAFSHAQMNGTFISVDGAGVLVRYNVGIRNRGNGSRTPPPNNYHVGFPSDRLWKDVSAININSKYTYNQLLGHTIFHMANLPALDARRVQVRVNGEDLAPLDPGRMYGSYVHLEIYDSDWTDNHLPDDSQGNLYRCASRGRYCDLRYHGTDPAVYGQEDWYAKNTNAAVNDWSDLIALTYALDRSPDEMYVQEMEEVVHVEQWARWFALEAFLANRETNLSNGYGDDYCLYRGVDDPRFMLLPYDLDSILDSPDPNTSIWLAGRLDSLPVIRRFLTHPAFVGRYYAQLKELAETVFAPGRFNPLVEQVLGGWVPPQTIEAIEAFAAARRRYVLSQIPVEFSVGSDLPIVDGYPVKSIPYAFATDVRGTADATRTQSVLVNGALVRWSPQQGQWALGRTTLDLSPGINRMVVETFDGPEGTGNRLAEGYADIHFQSVSVTPSDGRPGADMFWTADQGPYRITTDLTIPAHVTLTIGAGTTVFFDSNATMTIEGRLLAEGTPHRRIRFTRTPESGDTWNGVQFVNTPHDNQIRYAVIEYGRTNAGMVGLVNSNLLLDHVTFDRTDLRRIRTIDSSLVVRDCAFTDLFAPGELPPTDVLSEHIRGSGVPADGRVIIENSIFGRTPGYNNAIQFDGAMRPDAIPQILNNVFMGGGNNALDLDADAHIEGNLFMDYVKDRFNETSRESNAISAGGGRDYVVVRNVFHHVEHVAQIKDGSCMWFENNTVVDVNASAFHFATPGRTTLPGRGIWVDSCIFRECPTLLDSFHVGEADWGSTDVAVHRSLLPSDWHELDEGNLDADPLFVGDNDFRLQSISAARQAGKLGLDMGAFVPAGASVAGEPQSWTYRTDVVLNVGGPGITDYVYSVNAPNGPWSEEMPVDVPISLTGLGDGQSYTVYVRGRNSAGAWQDQPNASHIWTMETAYRRLVLNEILAVNESYEHEGTFPALVELYYDGPSAMNLSGVSLTDNPQQPDKFVFPAGVTMNPGDHLVLFADADADAATSGIHLGFVLDSEGGEVHLYDRDGHLIDSVPFGSQVPDLSIGRMGRDAEWRLAVPTFGFANVAHPLGNPSTVKINEWLAEAMVLFDRDFIELYNPHDSPVDIGGFHLTDHPMAQPDRHRIAPLSFIPSRGFTIFTADGQAASGHADFKLSSDGELIGLFDPNLKEIDKVIFGPQTPDVSQGRAPDGSDRMDWLELPTPGLANLVRRERVVTRTTLVPENADKRVIVPVSADHVHESWKSDPAFDDSSWLQSSGGPGGIGYERSSGYEDWISLDIENQMYGRNTSCYIRISFTIAAGFVEHVSELMLGVRYDDGFIAYLNGAEVARINVTGTPQWNSQAEASHESYSQTFDAVFDISDYAGRFRDGENLLAIHALNASTTSSDFLISAMLEASAVEGGDDEYPYTEELRLLDFLRVSELMYHSTAGDSLDYIELSNIGDAPLDLTGLRFTDGIQFTFGPMILGAGECVVVVDNLAAFRQRYGTGPLVAGEYSGRLSNGGEDIVLKLAAPLEAAIMRFAYEDDWYPTTDGGGQSLAIEDMTVSAVSWNDSENWYPSPPTPGSP